MGRPSPDYTGMRFGRLVGIRNTGEKRHRSFLWEWLCDCGNLHKALGIPVRNGTTSSCGCYRDNPHHLKAGDKFGRLTLMGRVHDKPLWRWRCDCSAIIDRSFQAIRDGRQVSCGCYAADSARARAKHGRWRTRTYRAWIAMKARCIGDACPEHYRLRGITVDPSWLNSFDTFFSDMGECPKGLTLERQDNDGPYGPGNCRWATQAEQLRNTRRSVFVIVDGHKLCLKDACAAKGVHYDRIRSRIRSGRDPQEAIDSP